MIDRRQFIAYGAALAGSSPRSLFGQTPTVDRVIVVGAGIVGASIAYYLAKRGCEVTIIDKGLPASQASGNTFAWINAAYANSPQSYLSLRLAALAEYAKLSSEVSFPIRWSGSLEWFQDAENTRRLADDIARFQDVPGSATTMIDRAAAARIEPNLEVGGDFSLAHSTNDGAIDAKAATQAIFDRALELGARTVLLAEVETIRKRRRSVRVTTTGGDFDADLVVAAAGVDSRNIGRMVGERIDTDARSTPGIIATTGPLPMIINTVLYPPRVHLHQLPDGRVVIGEKAGAPATDTHRQALNRRPNAFPDDAQAAGHALRLLAMAREYVPELGQARNVDVGIGWRPMPPDGLPIVGHGKEAPYVYFATMHSGVTLAPIIGRYAADEILDGSRITALADFRPDRF